MNSSQQIPSSSNLAFVEELYANYLGNADSVSKEWREYFSSLQNGEPPVTPRGPSFRAPGLFNPSGFAKNQNTSLAAPTDIAGLQDKVNQLVRIYRGRGHMLAQLDPLDIARGAVPELEPTYFHISDGDMDRPVSSGTFQSADSLTVRELLQRLRNTYCRSIGVEYMHIDDLALRRWLQKRMEPVENRLELTRQEQLRIFTRLTDATIFEEFIHKKFIGAKSFSLEGSESLIPLLDLALEKAGEHGVKEVVFGMAHRGRLNVLANIIGKSPRQIFREFADSDKRKHAGDVKYHLGHSGDWKTASGKTLHLSLCFNPSHLEFVSPVALGRVRAKQDRAGDREKILCMGLLIHGDSAFAGEGVVQETFNLSELAGYFVGGTLHVVLNNQIGFTTSPNEARSSLYATDVAKMLQIPIFHVNGEDPEAVAQVVQLAMDFRLTFKRDVVIDMWGYRRLGHNESDEPSFTQPMLYRAIEKRKPVREGYLDHLLRLNGITREEADAIATQRRENLERELSESRKENFHSPAELVQGIWSRSKYSGGAFADVAEAKTGVDGKQLIVLLKTQTELPQDFHPHPKIEKFLEARRKMADGKAPLDWSAAEALAFASLATENFRVRLSGQDSGRGTFTQRHAILHDYEDGHRYIPLQHLSEKQARVEILNSPLSETGVLGFDYGYSLDYPDGLILWEAQFGDFVNAAQVIIDQFIVSAEDKWRRLSGIVLLLPHGFEGMGPEHSSARLERFLTLAAEDNIQVVYPSTPAQYFHCLRRQMISPWRKPLVVMTPKSLLRHPQCVSNLSELGQGSFQYVIPDSQKLGAKIKRVLLCTGKIFYDLQKHREEMKCNDIAIVRLEQLYPLNEGVLKSVLAKFDDATPVFWVQEEPANMGAWPFLRVTLGEKLFGRFPFSGIYREASASPATGSANRHKHEQQQILTEAFKQEKISEKP
ncbi:MAG: 2-oxoglutarate dehydrogenase E1 component [Verrucomicrobiota bacterium]